MDGICDYCGEFAYVEGSNYGSLCESCFMQVINEVPCFVDVHYAYDEPGP